MSVSVWSHPLYWWYNTLYLWHYIYCIYGTIYTVYDISPTIYVITTLYSLHQSYYISPHTNYIWQHIHCITVIPLRLLIIQPLCIYDNTATICMTSYELHVTSHPLLMISHHAMTSHPLYSCHDTEDTCHPNHCSWTITYSVLIIPNLRMCDMKATICMTSQEFYMTSHSLFMT